MNKWLAAVLVLLMTVIMIGGAIAEPVALEVDSEEVELDIVVEETDVDGFVEEADLDILEDVDGLIPEVEENILIEDDLLGQVDDISASTNSEELQSNNMVVRLLLHFKNF